MNGAVEQLETIQPTLLAWFAASSRDLPWRQTRDPYRVLVSEIMLQQTQVDRVVPKYLAFLELFPTAAALAAAPTGEVIRAWAGLGYNRRAVNLQRACRLVTDELGGVFPNSVAGLRALPGIGPYTAGAVACFAFEQDVGFLDTNIRRVVQRVFVGPEPAAEPELVALAAAAVPPGQGWAWNQAIMELGALVCTAANPQCWRCPLQLWCQDYATRRAADEQVFTVAAPPRRSIAEKRETPYAGSKRFYRGKIIAALRALGPLESHTLATLGPLTKPDFAPDELEWLRELAAGLARDGLLVLDDDRVRLPD